MLEDKTTIRILEEQKLAVSISECDLEHIDVVVERMDRELSDEGFGLYYDAVQEIAEHILVHHPKSNYVDCDAYFFDSASQKNDGVAGYA